jgi:hypothetical protein
MEERMPLQGCRGRDVARSVAALLLTLACPALAHETQSVKQYRLTLGWGEEPAYSGYRNSVDVDLADAAGAPVADLGGGSLSVEVSFGDERIVLPLLPSGERPGRFRAGLVPTRAGTYVFHVTGTVKGQAIDARSTCSEETFHCVTDVSELQFPAKDPSAGELAESIGRALPRAERAMDVAANARSTAIAAIAVAALALIVAVALAARRGKQGA